VSINFSGIVSKHGSVKILTTQGWERVSRQKLSNRYFSVSFILEECQIVHLDLYFESQFAKEALSGYFVLREGRLIETEYSDAGSKAAKYLHEIYEELADPSGYQG
jgi:endo-1,4-beta-mannosidase